MGRTGVVPGNENSHKVLIAKSQRKKALVGHGCRHEGTIKNERGKKRGAAVKTNGAPAKHHTPMSVRRAAGS
jgi:hypothetical protein